MPGGHDIVKVPKKRKTQSKQEQNEKALARAISKLGEDEAKKVQEEYKKYQKNKELSEGVILTLIATGLSGIEMKSLLGIGGYKVS